MTSIASVGNGKPAHTLDLCVLDLGETWERWQAMADPPPGQTFQIRVLGAQLPPASSLLLITVPAQGLDADQRNLVHVGIKNSEEIVLAASVGSDQLNHDDREVAGYRLLSEQIWKQLGSHLIAIPQEIQQEASLVQQLLQTSFAKAAAITSLRNTDEDFEIAKIEAAAALKYSDPGIESLPEALWALMELERAEALLPFMDSFSEEELGARDTRRLADDVLRDRLPVQASLACRNASKRSPIVHGYFAERIIRGISNVTGNVRQEIADTRWAGCTIPELRAWMESTLASFARPEIQLPVVGRFSSGKTTFLNLILGTTPRGHRLLRTAWTHNTALVDVFHYCEPSEQRVEFTYKSELKREVLWEPGNTSERAKLAPCDGRVVSITELHDGTREIVLSRTSDSALSVVRIVPPQSMRNGLKAGNLVREGQKLSQQLSNTELLAKATMRDDTREDIQVTIHGSAIARVLKLIQEKKLIDVRFETSLLVKQGQGYVIEQHTFTDADTGWMQMLKKHADRERPTPIQEIDSEFPPLEIYLSANVSQSACIPSHELVSDEDWDWFQGPPTQAGSEISTRECDLGFAESADAEMLMDEAHIFLHSPLFQLLSIVDTPGLNSVSAQHSDKTENFIRVGTAFLVVLELKFSGSDHTTEELFEMISSTLRARGSNPADSSPADHVFILLNWFNKHSNERNWRGQMDALMKLVREAFHPCPRIYLADLKEQACKDVAEDMRGYPSLAALFRDLRRYVVEHGIDRKFQEAIHTLQHAWTNSATRLENQGADIEGKSKAKSIAELLQARAALSEAMKRGGDMADSRIAKVLEAAESSRALSFLMVNREGFAEARKDSARLGSYNNARARLKDITPFQQRELTAAVKGVISPPTIEDTNFALLPTLRETGFSSALAEVDDSWPGLWTGFKKFWKRAFDEGEMTRHVTVERRNMEDRFFSEIRGSGWYERVDEISKNFKKRFLAAEWQAKRDIEDRERTLQKSQQELEPEREELRAALQERAEFEGVYDRTVRTLREQRMHIQEISRRG